MWSPMLEAWSPQAIGRVSEHGLEFKYITHYLGVTTRIHVGIARIIN